MRPASGSAMRKGRALSEDLRVLVVNAGWASDADENGEVRELVAGMIAAAPVGSRVLGSDCRSVYAIQERDGRLELDRLGSWRLLLAWRFDVVHVHLVIPPVQLAIALLTRLRGARVVLSPMSMLGSDFATSSWFRDRGPVFRRFKPTFVSVWRTCWRAVASVFVCASAEEVQQAGLPPERCVLVPLAAPNSALGAAARNRGAPTMAPLDAPVALVSRLDIQRKGFDRMATWLRAFSGTLPRPAVRVFAPTPDELGPFAEFVDRGLLDWEPAVRGADLADALQGCRGVMLLSRWDGQPRVLREGVLLGLPTLATVSSHFMEVVAVLGSGVTVDGDDPSAVQAGFRQLADDPRSAARGRVLFDRDVIGTYLWATLAAAARGGRPDPPSYYQAVAPHLPP